MKGDRRGPTDDDPSKNREQRLEAILRFHPSIRYVRLLGRDGRSHAFVQRGTSLEPRGQTHKILLRLALAQGMTSTSDRFYGKARAIIILREKLVELLFLLTRDDIMLVGADPDFPVERAQDLAEMARDMPSRDGARRGRGVPSRSETSSSRP
ncbi:MAG: hypothetical protein ABSF83_05435 [Nitrososphaerales archaeon]|jgi:hypothetical protein